MSFFNPIAIISILIAISIHEWAHAVAATRLGDPTPGDAGRLTINPIAHIDLLGALMFLLVGFGWAKPVPVNPMYFRHPKRDTLLVAIAGPISNLLLAFVAFVGLTLLGEYAGGSVWGLIDSTARGSVGQAFLLQFLSSSLFINLGLMAFNILPIAPLDGSKVLQAFIPPSLADQYDNLMRVGPFILLGILVAEMTLNVRILSAWIVTIMEWVLSWMEALVALFL